MWKSCTQQAYPGFQENEKDMAQVVPAAQHLIGKTVSAAYQLNNNSEAKKELDVLVDDKWLGIQLNVMIVTTADTPPADDTDCPHINYYFSNSMQQPV